MRSLVTESPSCVFVFHPLPTLWHVLRATFLFLTPMFRASISLHQPRADGVLARPKVAPFHANNVHAWVRGSPFWRQQQHSAQNRLYRRVTIQCMPDQTRCPVAGAFSFTADHEAGGELQATVAPVSERHGSPLALVGGGEWATPHTWLAAGVSGQPTKGRLVAGLRQLKDLDEFLLELPDEMPWELKAKAR